MTMDYAVPETEETKAPDTTMTDENAANGGTETENAPAEEENPQDRLVRVDSKEYLLKQVMALPYSESQTIFLHYYQDLKIDEIAEMLDMSRSTVKRHLADGKARLRKVLSPQGKAGEASA